MNFFSNEIFEKKEPTLFTEHIFKVLNRAKSKETYYRVERQLKCNGNIIRFSFQNVTMLMVLRSAKWAVTITTASFSMRRRNVCDVIP
jgi:hypothetical protein